MIFAMAKTKRLDGRQGATARAASSRVAPSSDLAGLADMPGEAPAYTPCLSPSPYLACLSDLPDELPVLSAEVKLVRVYFRDLIEQALHRNANDP
jgi:hypothetical protein